MCCFSCFFLLPKNHLEFCCVCPKSSFFTQAYFLLSKKKFAQLEMFFEKKVGEMLVQKTLICWKKEFSGLELFCSGSTKRKQKQRLLLAESPRNKPHTKKQKRLSVQSCKLPKEPQSFCHLADKNLLYVQFGALTFLLRSAL